ncbi:glycosyltransferase [Epilithonimonas sp.]|uniref:glycosyltransferase n=1 Tax=Epilithonimonas sp. TaxID=2894511 RepID=UPI00289DF5A7|nr:glycosyltransferase [Epilithonimonas sp.]
MMKILFGIVCFREKFWETKSFISLLASVENYQKPISIFVFDNTDDLGWDAYSSYTTTEFAQVDYKHNPKNPGIAVAYNTIARHAREQHFSHIVFLDQDTELPSNFFSEYLKTIDLDLDIAAPLIYENRKLLSPSIYKNYRTSFYDKIDNDKIKLKGNSCINSGLLVKTDFFFKIGGYNETLRLDFCDHEFIKRAADNTQFLNIIPVKLEQNFSTNTNPLDKALFRYDLFSKDVKAFKKINKNDIKIALFVDLPHIIRLTLQYKSFAFIKQRFF